MPTRVEFAEPFIKKLKNLAKKYLSATDQVDKLITELENGERPGDKVPGVGYDVYKVRLPNPSASKGKSGGFRVIYYLRLQDFVVLITIYAKTEHTDVSIDFVRQVIDEFQSSWDDET
jgi:mRNA-degrading endonuclease RelE of RelBE toxin-antitoxin system